MNSVASHFAVPWLPWLLLGLPLVVAAQLLISWRRRKQLAKFAQPLPLATLIPPKPRWRWLKTFAVSTGTTLLLIAIAGPRWGHDATPEVVPGRDIVLVLDMSRSMLATDAPPTRFDRARNALTDLVQALRRRGGHRLALVVLGSDAQIVVPLTHDYAHVIGKIAALDVEVPPARLRPKMDATSGTRLGAALKLATQAHDTTMAGFQDVIVLSDGDDPLGDAEWQAGLREIAALGIPVHTIGIGDPHDFSPVPGRPGAETRLREHPLREIARQTGGHYLTAYRDAPPVVDFFKQRIEPKSGTTAVSVTPPQPRSQHMWFYLAALVLLATIWIVGYAE